MKQLIITAIATVFIFWQGIGLLSFILCWIGIVPYLIIILILTAILTFLGHTLGKNDIKNIKYLSWGAIVGIIPILIYGYHFYSKEKSHDLLWPIVLITCIGIIVFFIIGLNTQKLIKNNKSK